MEPKNPTTTSTDTQEKTEQAITPESVQTSPQVMDEPKAKVITESAPMVIPESNNGNSVDTETTTSEVKTSDDAPAIKVGDLLTGTITKHVHQMVFVALDRGGEGYISVSELRDEQGNINVILGQQIEAKVKNLHGGVELTRDYLLAKQEIDRLEKALTEKTIVKGKVVATNKGGYEIRIGSINAFCPRSHFSLRPERAPQQQIGKMLDFNIEELKTDKKLRVVVSRRQLLEAAERERAQLMGERFSADDLVQGRVTQLSKFGAFVDVGDGIEGLIPMSELSHSHVNRASDILKTGQTVDVKVISVDSGRGRLSLSLKQLIADPWVSFVDQHDSGAELTGKITRITDFGAFVELAPSVEGLLHISAITTKGRLNHPSEKLTEGQELQVIIEEVVRNSRRDQRKIRLMTPEVAERRKPIDIKIKVDQVITAPVKETGERGVTIVLASNLDGFIPSSETGTQRGANLKEHFPVGKEVQAKVLSVDLRRAKVRLSIKALANHEEQMAFKQFKTEMRSDQQRMTSTFGDLLKNFN